MSTPILVWLGVHQDSFVPTESVAEQQERKARGEV
jgi:preprotein translocase subunit SecF